MKLRATLMALSVTAAGLAAAAAHAAGEAAGDFDYYVMALSWSPNWCALTGDARGDPQCGDGLGLTFILHGLWPQHDNGYPSDCRTTERDPSRRDTEAMSDLMGSSGLAWYQWKKHGRCAGLPASHYYALMRRARDSVTMPPLFSRITKDLTLPAAVIEDAFLEANPTLARDQVTVTCKARMIQEVRICLTKDLTPRRCGPDVIRDCTLADAGLEAVR